MKFRIVECIVQLLKVFRPSISFHEMKITLANSFESLDLINKGNVFAEKNHCAKIMNLIKMLAEGNSFSSSLVLKACGREQAVLHFEAEIAIE